MYEIIKKGTPRISVRKRSFSPDNCYDDVMNFFFVFALIGNTL